MTIEKLSMPPVEGAKLTDAGWVMVDPKSKHEEVLVALKIETVQAIKKHLGRKKIAKARAAKEAKKTSSVDK